jgi:hypothetical protein
MNTLANLAKSSIVHLNAQIAVSNLRVCFDPRAAAVSGRYNDQTEACLLHRLFEERDTDHLLLSGNSLVFLS